MFTELSPEQVSQCIESERRDLVATYECKYYYKDRKILKERGQAPHDDYNPSVSFANRVTTLCTRSDRMQLLDDDVRQCLRAAYPSENGTPPRYRTITCDEMTDLNNQLTDGSRIGFAELDHTRLVPTLN